MATPASAWKILRRRCNDCLLRVIFAPTPFVRALLSDFPMLVAFTPFALSPRSLASLWIGFGVIRLWVSGASKRVYPSQKFREASCRLCENGTMALRKICYALALAYSVGPRQQYFFRQCLVRPCFGPKEKIASGLNLSQNLWKSV